MYLINVLIDYEQCSSRDLDVIEPKLLLDEANFLGVFQEILGARVALVMHSIDLRIKDKYEYDTIDN